MNGLGLPTAKLVSSTSQAGPANKTSRNWLIK